MGRPRSDCLALDTARCLAPTTHHTIPCHTIPYHIIPYHHPPDHTIPSASHLSKVNPPASVIRRCHPQILFCQPEKSLFVEQANSGADWHQVENQTLTYLCTTSFSTSCEIIDKTRRGRKSVLIFGEVKSA